MARSTQSSPKQSQRLQQHAQSQSPQRSQRPPRSTASPPPTSSARPTRSSVVPSQPLKLADYESDASESGSSEANALTQLQGYGSSQEIAEAVDSSIDEADGAGAMSDDEIASDVAITSDTSAPALSDDDVYLQDLALAAEVASQSVADPDWRGPSKRGKNGRSVQTDQAEFFASLLDSVRRSDLRNKTFHYFIRYDQRNTTNAPKRELKNFVELKSKAFNNLYELYGYTVRAAQHNDDVLNAFESFLAELMDCFDHPHEVHGWNPFSALADFVEAGAVVRTPEVVKSCSRLTLGADFGLLSEHDEQRIGAVILPRLYKLHHWRMAEINEVLGRWAGKFRQNSTCGTCNTDPWEIFLLTTVMSMIKWGTKYVDVETASDSDSDASNEARDTAMDVDSNEGDDDDDNERDNHQGLSSDSEHSEDEAESEVSERLDPEREPIDEKHEPRRRDTSGLQLQQFLLHNYGPNAYVLRIVNEGTIGSGVFKRAPFKICPRCGYRFDGEIPERGTLVYRDLERAIDIAREQIAALQEVINLPSHL